MFIGGRIPVLGGDFNIMFYNIVKKIFKFVLALSFVVMCIGLADMTIVEEKKGLRQSFMRALVHTLGEYNLDEIVEKQEGDTVMKTFAFIILVCTIIFGSLTIINLFVAVLVSDIKALREEGFLQVGVQSILSLHPSLYFLELG